MRNLLMVWFLFFVGILHSQALYEISNKATLPVDTSYVHRMAITQIIKRMQNDINSRRDLLPVSNKNSAKSTDENDAAPEKKYSGVRFDIEDIDVQANITTARCTVILSDSISSVSLSMDFLFIKSANNWVPGRWNEWEKIVGLLDSNKAILRESIKENGLLQMRLSENSFRQIPVVNPLIGPPIWEINWYLTQDYLNDYLYTSSQVVDGAVYCTADNPPKQAGITLDRLMKRIIYGCDESNTLKSYGDTPGDFVFGDPSSIDVNEFGEVFVTDIAKGCVVKLQYDYNSNTISPSANPVFITGLLKPVDISYGSGSLYFDRNDDLIAVADPNQNCIFLYNSYGTKVKEIHDYKINQPGASNIPLSRPIRVCLFDTYNTIAMIDEGSNSAIIGYTIDDWPSTLFLYQESEPIKFYGESNLCDIGSGFNFTVLVTDAGLRAIHKFTNTGKYSCSFNNAAITRPFSNISNHQNKFPRPLYQLTDFYISNMWGANSGIREYFNAADAINFSSNENGVNFEFSFVCTDVQDYYVELINLADGSVKKSWGNSTSPLQGYTAESKIYSINKSEIGYGNYMWRVYFRPYHDLNRTGYYKVGWKSSCISFAYSAPPPPPPPGITPKSIVIVPGQTKNLRVSFPGATSYAWHKHTFPQGAIFSSNGATATITYCSNKSTDMSGFLPGKAPISSVSVLGNDNSYDDVPVMFIGPAPQGGGCPFVYTWNDTVWIEDNNILPRSQDEGRQGSFTDDYYQLYNKPVLTDEETYKLAIGEFEQEQSYIDLVKLILVDHSRETNITVDDSGRVYQFAKPAFFASAAMDTVDVLKMLFEADGRTAEAEADSRLEMSFEGTIPGSEKWMVVAGRTMTKNKTSGIVKAKDTEAFTDFRLRRNQSYVWIPVHQDSVSTVMVDVLWKETSTIDYAELSHRMELPFTVTVPELLSATHSVDGDVLQKLTQEDGDATVISPNQWVTLDFRAPELAEGLERSFIFASKGYYQLFKNNKANTSGINDKNLASEKPKDYALMQNSPNPFNPSTVIQYQLPKDGQVKLSLFDILGREVMVLVDDYKTAGSYSYQFNAAGLSSGVYIYRMDSGNFHSSKKLTLLK